MNRAAEEARALGDASVLDIHLLLSVLFQRDTDLVKRLNDAGLTYELAHSAYVALPAPGRREHSLEPTLAPVAYTVLGRAHGLAIAAGLADVSAESLTLAILWEPNQVASAVLRRLSLDRAALARVVATEGQPAPRTPVPASSRWSQPRRQSGQPSDLPHLVARHRRPVAVRSAGDGEILVSLGVVPTAQDDPNESRSGRLE